MEARSNELLRVGASNLAHGLALESSCLWARRRDWRGISSHPPCYNPFETRTADPVSGLIAARLG
jgi:hypothetical protein